MQDANADRASYKDDITPSSPRPAASIMPSDSQLPLATSSLASMAAAAMAPKVSLLLPPLSQYTVSQTLGQSAA